MIMPLPGSSHTFSSQVEGRLAKSRYSRAKPSPRLTQVLKTSRPIIRTFSCLRFR
jgi:hypothetical protein